MDIIVNVKVKLNICICFPTPRPHPPPPPSPPAPPGPPAPPHLTLFPLEDLLGIVCHRDYMGPLENMRGHRELCIVLRGPPKTNKVKYGISATIGVTIDNICQNTDISSELLMLGP